MFDLEDRYWWFVGRRHIVSSLLRVKAHLSHTCRTLDLGCGSGGNLKVLSAMGAVFGADRSEQALQLCARRGDFLLILADGEDIPAKDCCFNLVTALDVLEHIEDDQAVLREMYRILKPGGRALITVPAYPSLWSEHDEALHHKRRYRLRELHQKAELAGFRVEKLSHAICAVLAPVYLLRWMQRLRPGRQPSTPKTGLVELPAFPNWLLVEYLRLESFLIPRVNLPFGVSIVCLAAKPDEVQR